MRSLHRNGADQKGFGISQQAFCNAKFAFVRTNALLATTIFYSTISMLRKLQNLTQDELAERIHVSKDHISRIERGIRACSLESLIDLAQELHTSTDYLLTGTGPANDFAKEQLLSAIEVLSSVSKLI